MTIYIPGNPVGKQRQRHNPENPRQRPRTPEKTRAYEQRIGWAWKQAHGPMYEGPVQIRAIIFLKCPESYPQKTRNAMLSGEILPTKTPDASNVLKSAEDGLNGIAYKDDAQIDNICVERYYSDEPGLLITVEPICKEYMIAGLQARLWLRDATKRRNQ